MLKLCFALFLASSAYAEQHSYFVRMVSAAQMRTICQYCVDPLARDTVQVFAGIQNPASTSMVVRLHTRRNGVDRVLVGESKFSPGTLWTVAFFEVDEVFTNLEITSVEFEEHAAPVAASTAGAPVRVVR